MSGASEGPTELDEVDDSRDWDGFRRQRWSNRYALLFALLFAPATGITFMGIDISRHARGHDVANLLVGIFVVVVLAAGLFLAKALAWRYDEDARRRVTIVTVVVGLATLLGAGAFLLTGPRSPWPWPWP